MGKKSYGGALAAVAVLGAIGVVTKTVVDAIKQPSMPVADLSDLDEDETAERTPAPEPIPEPVPQPAPEPEPEPVPESQCTAIVPVAMQKQAEPEPKEPPQKPAFRRPDFSYDPMQDFVVTIGDENENNEAD